MKNSSFIGFRQWLHVGALALGLSIGLTALNPAAFAQVIPGDPDPEDRDHLKCYEVRQDQNPLDDKEVDLVNKFGLEPNCHVATKARLFCTLASKVIEGNGDDPLGLESDTPRKAGGLMSGAASKAVTRVC
jgi:hypothetical protein